MNKMTCTLTSSISFRQNMLCLSPADKTVQDKSFCPFWQKKLKRDNILQSFRDCVVGTGREGDYIWRRNSWLIIASAKSCQKFCDFWQLYILWYIAHGLREKQLFLKRNITLRKMEKNEFNLENLPQVKGKNTEIWGFSLLHTYTHISRYYYLNLNKLYAACFKRYTLHCLWKETPIHSSKIPPIEKSFDNCYLLYNHNSILYCNGWDIVKPQHQETGRKKISLTLIIICCYINEEKGGLL